MKLYAAHLDFTAIIDEFRLNPTFPPDVLADAATATREQMLALVEVQGALRDRVRASSLRSARAPDLD